MQISRQKKIEHIARKYEMFHGKKARKVTTTDFHVPKYLIYLGEAHAIEYRSNKLNGGGDGRLTIYTHRIETKCALYMDERCQKQLYLIGDKIKVTSRGIEN